MTSIPMRKAARAGRALRQAIAGFVFGALMIFAIEGGALPDRDTFTLHGDGPGAIVGSWMPSAHVAISLRLDLGERG